MGQKLILADFQEQAADLGFGGAELYENVRDGDGSLVLDLPYTLSEACGWFFPNRGFPFKRAEVQLLAKDIANELGRTVHIYVTDFDGEKGPIS